MLYQQFHMLVPRLKSAMDVTWTHSASQGSGLWPIGACDTQARSKIADFDLGTCADARVRLTRWTPLPVANADNSRRLLFYHSPNSTDAARDFFLEVTRFWLKFNSPACSTRCPFVPFSCD